MQNGGPREQVHGHLEEPLLIFDLGLHLGEDAEFYLKKGFRVVGVEANSRLCDRVEQRLQSYIADDRLQIVNAAITSADGPVTFYENVERSVWGTTSPDWAERNRRLGTTCRETVVDGVSLDKIIAKYGVPYYLKIDIEGVDCLCLKQLLGVPQRPRYVSIESEKVSWDALLEEFRLLGALGYNRFKVVNQIDVPKQRCPFPALEGNYVEHHFEFGSSGMFGDEAPGKWMPAAEAIRAYRRVFIQYRLYGDDGLLHRLAIGRMLIRRLRIKPPWFDTHAAHGG